MFDVYDFFNSPDVAEHCKKLGKTFDALESAVLVYRCKKGSYEKKHEAFRAIISEYQDVYVEPEEYRSRITSVHEALEHIIEDGEQRIKDFLKEEPGTLYQATIWDPPVGGHRFNFTKRPFKTYEEALSDALDIEGTFSKNAWGTRERTFDSVAMQKLGLTKNKFHIATISPDGEIIDIYENDPFLSKSEEVFHADNEKWVNSKYSEAACLLESANIKIPVPFKRGDIVEINDLFGTYQLNDTVYLIKDNNEENSKYSFISFYWGKGNVFEGNLMHSYSYYDVEYCKRELKGEERILYYLSLYEQGEISMNDLLDMHRYLFLDRELQKLELSYNKVSEILRLEQLPY